MAEPRQRMTAGAAILAIVPLVLLVALVAWLFSDGAEGLFATDLPPVEAVDVMRHVLESDVIHLDIVNSGPDPTTIAQVMVRGAFWYHEVSPAATMGLVQSNSASIPERIAARVTLRNPLTKRSGSSTASPRVRVLSPSSSEHSISPNSRPRRNRSRVNSDREIPSWSCCTTASGSNHIS